jgi:hypothetical protein
LKEKIKLREIAFKDRKTLIEILSKNPSSIQIVTKALDSESLQFGEQFKEVLEEAKWGVLLQKMSTAELQGLTIFTNTENGYFRGKDLLITTLKCIGLEVKTEVVPRNRLGGGYAETPCVIMVIGNK